MTPRQFFAPASINIFSRQQTFRLGNQKLELLDWKQYNNQYLFIIRYRIIILVMLKQSTLAFAVESQTGQYRVFRLGESVPTFAAASNSVILSLAAFLKFKFPKLPHPDYEHHQFQSTHQCLTDQFPSHNLSLHPRYEAWCDTLCHAVIQGNAIRVSETLYILIPVSYEYSKNLHNHHFEEEVFESKVKINRIFNLPQIQWKSKKIFLLNFAISQLRQNKLLPKVHIPALILGSIFDNEQWKFYSVLKGQFPTKNQLLQADAVILPGSSNSVLDKVEPVDLFVKQFMQAFEENPKLRVLGICYGHQLISKLFGAKVVKKNRYQGHEQIKFDQKLIGKYGYLRHISERIDQQWIMPEHHQDYVEEVPEGFDLIASSSSCYVQAMAKQDGRILSFQYHPEYLSQFTFAFTHRSNHAKAHYHLSFALDVPKQKIKSHHEACTLMRMSIKDFLSNS